MKYYARLCRLNRWIADDDNDIDSLPGEAITVDLQCAGNEWSMYEVESADPSPARDSNLRCVLAKMISGALNRIVHPCTVAFISEERLKSLGLGIRHDPEKIEGPLGQCHVNVFPIMMRHIKSMAGLVFDIFSHKMDVLALTMQPHELLSLLYEEKEQLIVFEKEKLKNRKKVFLKLFKGYSADRKYLEIIDYFDVNISKIQSPEI